MTALIQIEDVSKFYHMGGETIRALDDISLDIVQGEFVAIIGPSGSGNHADEHHRLFGRFGRRLVCARWEADSFAEGFAIG